MNLNMLASLFSVPFVSPGWASLSIVYLTATGLIDLKTSKVPNWLTWPAIIALLVWRVYHGDGLLILAYWIPVILIGFLNIAAPGDIKLLMVECALWPSTTFVVVLGAGVAIIGIVSMLISYKSPRGVWQMVSVAAARLTTGDPPKQAELEFYGTPSSYLYAVPGMIFVTLTALRIIPM